MMTNEQVREMIQSSDVKRMVLSVARMTVGKMGDNAPSDLVDDVYQETMLHVIERFQRYYSPDKGTVVAFLGTIAHNCAVDAMRSVTQRAASAIDTTDGEHYGDSDDDVCYSSTPVSRFPSPEQVTINRETINRIAAYLAKLPAREREIWEALSLDASEETAAPVAARHGLTVNAARIILCRVRKDLAERFA